MSLYTRLMGTTEPQIPAHSFMAAIGEVERGYLTATQAADIFALTTAERIEATELINRIVPPVESRSIGGFLTLTNVGTAYDSTPASKGLGIVRLESAGITGFEFSVFVSKVGSGTQSWQLWDVTNSTQVTVLDDAGAAGDKELSITQGVGPLAPGMRTLRVRVKSTTAADDPIYYGATLVFRRVALMTADVLHQILLLAENQYPPVTTEAELKTRLGIT